MTDNQKRRKPNKRVLEAIREGLDEFVDYFDIEVSSDAKEAPIATEPARGSSEQTSTSDNPGRSLACSAEILDDEDEDDFYGYDENEEGDRYVQKEDIEVVVDAFISSLISAKIIPKGDPRRLPSFSDIFCRFFDEGEGIVDLAVEFEENIEGYMDWISPDEIKSAKENITAIRDIILELLGEKAHVK